MKKIILSILLLAGVLQNVNSQTATGVVTQVPCNNDGVFSVTTTGMPLPITYTYYTNGTTVVHTNVNAASDQLSGFGAGYGYVQCSATSGGLNAYTSDSYTPPFQFYNSVSNPICPLTMGTLTTTQTGGSTGPFTYLWKNDLTLTTYSGNNAQVPVGDYSVIITDQTTGCVVEMLNDSVLYVYQQSSVTASVTKTPASCTNGTATAVPSGGVAPYTYLWANGATTSSIIGLSKGYISLVVTDNQGCESNYLGANIQQNPNISVNTTVGNATCVQSDGSVMAFGSGGVSPYSYVWSNGHIGQTVTNLQGANGYSVIATDANGCFGQSYAYVNSSTPVTVTYTSTASQCTSPTGSATLSATGGTAPYTYSWNVSPSVSGQTISNVGAGTYSFTVVDAVGCVRTGSAVIAPISTINASAQGGSVVCPATIGNAVVNAAGTNPPFTYLWSNGATTNQITGVPLGNYSCLITDAVNCTSTKTAQVKSVSPVSIGISTTPVTCVFSADGTVTATPTGGLAPYTYSYSNGATTATASGLAQGNYWLTVTDANLCSRLEHFSIGNSNTNSSCYCTISGNVYVDLNTDCNYDANESGIENIRVYCSGYGSTFTDVNGYYSFQVPTGTYTISEQINAYYPLTSCQNVSTVVNVVAANGCNTIVNIANDSSIISDLKILTVNSTIPPIPGNNYQQKVIVQNNGTTTESGIQLSYMHDGQLPFGSSTLAAFSPTVTNSYGVQSGFPSLNPNEEYVMLLDYNTPTNIPLGTVVSFQDTVANLAPIAVNWLTDYSPWNNVNAYETTVIGSYDPNYKEVSPKGTGPEGYIPTSTEEFDYIIHFQNEGTYFAQNISVTDQLDADLDWETFTPGYSDYNYTTTVSETGLVTFTFANINLPWKSQYGDALSSGLVSYSIQPKASSVVGTEFTNTADIFFDYNAPITTNTTINTFGNPVGVDEIVITENDGGVATLNIYPVPAKDVITIHVNNVLENGVATLSVINLMGSEVRSEKVQLNAGSTSFTQNVSSLAKGTYFTKIQFDNGSFLVKKIVLFK
jgi:hypothetical protein